MDKIGNARSGYTLASPLMSSTFSDRGSVSSKVNFDKLDFLVEESCVTNDLSSLKSNTANIGRPTAEGNHSSNTSGSCEISNTSSDQFSSSSNVPPGGAATIGLRAQSGFGLYFQEGYCKASELDECHELTGFVTDADSSSSHCEGGKTEEDGDKDDMLGGVFEFSEEGCSEPLTAG